MANIFRCHHINRILLSIVLSTFAIVQAVPVYSTQYILAKNDIEFALIIEHLMKRLVKSHKKGTDEMIDTLVEIKCEIEKHYSCSLNLDYAFDQIQRECKKQKLVIPPKYLAWIKTKILIADKKAKSRPVCLFEGDDALIDFDDDIFAKKEDDEKEGKEIPALLVYGVSVTCCGVFLMLVPIPMCKLWGERMIVAGVTACANAMCTAEDERKKK